MAEDTERDAVRVLALVGLNDREPNPKELEMAKYFLTEYDVKHSIDYAASRIRETLRIR